MTTENNNFLLADYNALGVAAQILVGDLRKCVVALELIAQLGDTGSDSHKSRYSPHRVGMTPGWRVAQDMAEIARDTLAETGLSSIKEGSTS
jgi:hypothetical protein